MFVEDEKTQEKIERLEHEVAFLESEESDSKKHIEELESEIDNIRFQLSEAEVEHEQLQEKLKFALENLEKLKHSRRKS